MTTVATVATVATVTVSHDCPICYDPITAGTGEVRMSCSHTFHLSCITTWLQRGNDNCPYCRNPTQPTERIPVAVAPVAAPRLQPHDYHNIIGHVTANRTVVNIPYLSNIIGIGNSMIIPQSVNRNTFNQN